jgi:two-component system, LuxR family, response regulator FixJ
MNVPTSPADPPRRRRRGRARGLALLIGTVGLRVQTWADPQAFVERLRPRQHRRHRAGRAHARHQRACGARALVAQGVDQPVIMLTGHGTVDLCRRAFKSGAAEFLEKPVDDELLLETLQHAVRQHVRSRQRHRADRDRRASAIALLSEREREVLGLIVAGLTNKEIGRALALSPRTVETHRANLFEKLQAESLAQVIRQYADLVEGDGSVVLRKAGVGVRMGAAAGFLQ